jgi:hypothetical protein
MKSNRIPKGFSVFIHADKSVHIILDNYDGNFLAFQILVIATPLFIASILTAINFSTAFFIVFLLLVAVVYWCLYNYKDKSKFIFTDEYFYVLEGLHQREKLKVRAQEVLRTEKTKNAGKILTSARTYSSTKTKPTYQLYIITSEEKFLVTQHVGPTGQEYLDDAINAWVMKVNQK